MVDGLTFAAVIGAEEGVRRFDGAVDHGRSGSRIPKIGLPGIMIQLGLTHPGVVISRGNHGTLIFLL